MKEENRYFIFDSPISHYEYFLKNIKYSVSSVYYKFLLNAFRPTDIKKKKYYSSVCAIFKNEASYLKEWITFHRLIGIEHFYLYNNFSDDNYQEILKPFVDSGCVTLTDWPVKQGQMKAYADCVSRFSEETNWIGFIDLDEFVVPNTKNNINEILQKFEKNRPVVIAYWRLFGTSGLLDRDRDRLVTESFSLCWRKYTAIGKLFFNTAYDYAEDLLINSSPHYRWAKYKCALLPPVNIYNKVICDGIHKGKPQLPPIQINHYFTKSYEEYKEKTARGDVFFEIDPKNEQYFYWHETKCQSADYNIRKYIIKLKRLLEEV